MRAVRRTDHPDNLGRWMASVDARLRELHTMVGTRARRSYQAFADAVGNVVGIGIDDETGYLALYTRDDGGVLIPHRTTTEEANARLDPVTGELQRVTSSEAGKTDIQDMPVDQSMVTKVRGMRRRVWRDASEVKADPNTTHWIAGWIAEELHTAGLGAFVEYDSGHQPRSVAYTRIPVLLHAWLGSVADQADRHESILASLTAAAGSTNTALGGILARLASAEATIKTQGEKIAALEQKNADQDKQLLALQTNLGTITTKLGIKL